MANLFIEKFLDMHVLGNSLFLLKFPSGMEWVVIGLIVLIFFGGRKIPELIRGITKGVKEFNDQKNAKPHTEDTDYKEIK